MPEVCVRKFAPGVCAGNCAGPSGGFVIRVVLFAFVAARVQFDPGGPGFVTTPVYRTQDRDPVKPIVVGIRVVDSSL